MVVTAFLWCAFGLALLIGGAELIVRGGTEVASRFGVPQLVIGLTIVAIGTSTPELAVGVDAALRGEGELAVGNIVGTNMVNILLILGLSALIRPLAIRMQVIRMDLPVIVLASLMLLAMAWDGKLSRTEGAVLAGAALIYTGLILHGARRESRRARAEAAPGSVAEPAPPATGQTVRSLVLLVAGIAIVVIGADWMVGGAVKLARHWGVSDAFIGLTIVAIGTSAPELVTTVISTIRDTRDIAIGNLLGSSVYNILLILGVTCLVPADGIPVGAELIRVDIPLMTGAALLCLPVFVTGRQVTRAEGALFVAAYAAYFAYLLTARV